MTTALVSVRPQGNHWVISIAVSVCMVCASLLAVILAPEATVRESSVTDARALEAVVPKAFGHWKLDTTVAPLQISADVRENLDRIYDQVLARTYVSNTGQRIMLSIAYGGQQTRATQVHKPEICYPAQGFQIVKIAKDTVHTPWGSLPVKRLVARQGPRNEPITYWIMVGVTPVTGAVDQNLARIRYALAGTIPDGMLIRVSSIDSSEEAAYSLHDSFIADMFSGVTPDARKRMKGADSTEQGG